MGFFTKGDIL